MEEDRMYEYAILLSSIGEKIQKGDLLGAVIVYNISVLVEPELLISRH